MYLILLVQDAAPATDVGKAVYQLTDFLLKYLTPLIAIGAFSMAFIELWKKLLDKRTKFQARRWTEWLMHNAKSANSDPLRVMQLWAEGIEVRVLHSLDDKVLHWAFPPGQQLAGRSEGSQRALGRYGPSVMMPGWSKTLRGTTITGADHSDYWGDGAAGPSLQATTEAGNFLRLGELRRDVSQPRTLSTTVGPPAPRSLVDGRSLPTPRNDCR